MEGLRPSQGALLEAFVDESELTLADWTPQRDVPYGIHARAVFDLYRSALPWRGTLVFIHAGYWQGRDKAQFRFLAPPFLRRGVDIVLLNYPLCPDVTLRELVETIRTGIPALLSHLSGLGRGGTDLIVAGHSAGGHIAAELALTEWRAAGLARSPVTGIVAVSGLYELAPLLATRINDKLGLDAREAHALSPLHRVRGPLPPAAFVVGGLETPEFRAQSELMNETWREAGGTSAFTEVASADHFSVLRHLAEDGMLFGPVMRLFAEAAS